MRTITLVVFGERAKAIEKLLGLDMVYDEADIYAKIYFKKLPAEGRSKIEVEFDI